MIYNPRLLEMHEAHIAHNTYLQVAAEGGLVTFGFLMALMIAGMRNCMRVCHIDPAGTIGLMADAIRVSLLAFAVASFFLTANYLVFYWLLVFISQNVREIAIYSFTVVPATAMPLLAVGIGVRPIAPCPDSDRLPRANRAENNSDWDMRETCRPIMVVSRPKARLKSSTPRSACSGFFHVWLRHRSAPRQTTMHWQGLDFATRTSGPAREILYPEHFRMPGRLVRPFARVSSLEAFRTSQRSRQENLSLPGVSQGYRLVRLGRDAESSRVRVSLRDVIDSAARIERQGSELADHPLLRGARSQEFLSQRPITYHSGRFFLCCATGVDTT